ncbi:hypothetical protein PsorP6_009763 [Peronosclerospora sorghi]|uniref:Uncharacterized protein n=1 Tax=Peronosclerospora sorghi TaxID=230839 RepID=A0ACC0W018_9STRA|nr:hypothetical protein PsorP6_009763 [Peronosclerospora sorghi]
MHLILCVVTCVALVSTCRVHAAKNTAGATYPTKSGIQVWVDPDTPRDKRTYVTSRGRTWDLVMSDEYNMKNRSFRPGDDHVWTSIEKPDGVNGALELYSHNMTGTTCDDSDETCYFYIEARDEVNAIRVYNMYKYPPGFENVYFYYRAGMVQSWNKFCFQGGMLEVRAQLPGAVSKASGNPDLALGESGKTASTKFYPTWPGIWMMGNLGRAIFSASTNRMWPFSYNECHPDVFDPRNQRISACDDNPGYGMHPNQGRGAPEIDLFEGGGLSISSSVQIAPGMPRDYRLFFAGGPDGGNGACFYTASCKTPGANIIDVPTAYYKKERGHKSWYQGLRYGANNYCKPNAKEKQRQKTVLASVKAGIKENTCDVDTCPASWDVNGDLGFADAAQTFSWGINTNGTCYPLINAYMGAYLCDPDNTNQLCESPRNASTPKSNSMSEFNYQMDAISSNWPLHLGAYTGFLTYQLEWVTGKNGYVRWMLDNSPLFEITAETITNVPQNSKKDNPRKIMLEEPMYLIMNVALSKTWGTTPPNPGKECRGSGTNAVDVAICDAFPMYMKVDYIRLYQDLGTDLEPDNYMTLSCDPSTHPTKKWIHGHMDEYEDVDNPWKDVAGKAFCTTDEDCTLGQSVGMTALKTGRCEEGRCVCTYASSWGGPRCTTALAAVTNTSATTLSKQAYGPPMSLSISVAAVVIFFSALSVYMSMLSMRKEAAALLKSDMHVKMMGGSIDDGYAPHRSTNDRPKDNYNCLRFIMTCLKTVMRIVAVVFALLVQFSDSSYATKSGIKTWVDPETPANRQVFITSRGRKWDLVMSDEFNVANRTFRPGEDHLWTSIEKPDGVNGALEIYAHNLTSTACDEDETCYLYIKVVDEPQTVSIYNMYKHPPGYQGVEFFYRAAMVQSWNKFCFQGGMLEVRAQLPGAVSPESGNPDLALGRSGKVTAKGYYPTWPGIWMMGNLGRAIFSASTNRMWPFSYNTCEPDVLHPSNQRISACDDNPGYGLNPNQGRGAPEIDLLEGGGLAISSSLQIAPGMPMDYRLFPPDVKGVDASNPFCTYSSTCKTKGANVVDVPTAYFKQVRGHKSWYQGLRYGAHTNCPQSKSAKQEFSIVNQSLRAGIKDNYCTIATCPASLDVNGDLSFIDKNGKEHWGINTNGSSCYPVMNSYMGAYLCDPDNTNPKCATPRTPSIPPSNTMSPFAYQMDAISSNWPIHLGAYLDYLVYQVEWVTGENGYVRWMLDGCPIFEVTTEALTIVPQNAHKTNPVKVMPEEPMYLIVNVALSSAWGATPPNPGGTCRGDGRDETINRICNEFPMYLKLDYIRLYQDLGADLPPDTYMHIGCDPKSHPTKEWIEGHRDEYSDRANPIDSVHGRAFCKTHDDCTIGNPVDFMISRTGTCVQSRCVCASPSWSGPRCTETRSDRSSRVSRREYGPPLGLAVGVGSVAMLLSLASFSSAACRKRRTTRSKAFDTTRRQQEARVSTFDSRSSRSGEMPTFVLKEDSDAAFVKF